MQLTTDDLTAAESGKPVRIDTDGQVFYLLSERAYQALTSIDYGSVSKEEMDALADEADAIISQSESDEY